MRARGPHPEDNRGRLLALLCSADRTANELAGELGISANAVREHLKRLEDDGLVEYSVVRHGVGKPAHQYHLTAEGSFRLSRAYLPLLSALLTVVRERVDAGEQEVLLQEVGRVLALQQSRPGGDLRHRAEAAVELLGALGGTGTLEEEDGGFLIRGRCCPLRAIVPDYPLACKAVETMLREFVGALVQERCDKQDPPTCRLWIGAAAVP